LPIQPPGVNEPQIHFVDEGRCLEGVTGPFPGHVMPRCAVQFPEDEWSQLLECLFVSRTPRLEQSGNFMRWRRIHRNLVDSLV
jgi:hypothetical protein